MLGLLDRCRWTKEKHLRLENYYFSSPTTMIDCYNPYAVNWLRKTFLPPVNVVRPTPKRFFIRRFGNNRNMTNESKVLDLFRELGWEIIDAGEWSFPDQIWLFSNAEAICGIPAPVLQMSFGASQDAVFWKSTVQNLWELLLNGFPNGFLP
jgi:Glycosyltransferase 61